MAESAFLYYYCLTTADITTEITGTQEEELKVSDEDEKKDDKLTRSTAEQVHLTIVVLELKT